MKIIVIFILNIGILLPEFYLLPDDKQKYIYRLNRDIENSISKIDFFGKELKDKSIFYVLKKASMNSKIRVIVENSQGFSAQLLPLENITISILKGFNEAGLNGYFIIIDNKFVYNYIENSGSVEIAFRSNNIKDIDELKSKFEILWQRSEKVDFSKCKK